MKNLSPKVIRLLLLPALMLLAYAGYGQNGKDSFLLWQRHYREEFLSDQRAPLKSKDTAGIRFYKYNSRFLFRHASVQVLKVQPTFLLATHSGRTKRARAYARISCLPHHGLYGILPAFLRGKGIELFAYQILPATGDSLHDDALFVPFYDATNGITTYGGGRYMDFHISDIKDARLRVDFNHAYNPWCAYKEGYNCPIPPEENRVKMAIEAGERMYEGGNVEGH